MSAERLKALVEQGNLINLNIMSDALGSLLNEIAQMLVEQQRQIVQLKKEVGEKVTKSDFTTFKDQWRNDREMILRSFPNFDMTLEKINTDFEAKTRDIKNQVDTALNSNLMVIDSRINQKLDFFTADLSVVQHSVSNLENKLRAQSSQVGFGLNSRPDEEMKKKIARLETDLQALSARQQEIIRDEVHRYSETTSTRVSPATSGITQVVQSSPPAVASISSTLSSPPPSTTTPPVTTKSISPTKSNIPATAAEPTPSIPIQPQISAFPTPSDIAAVVPELQEVEPIEECDQSANEIEDLRNGMINLETILDEQNKSLVSRIERKAEISLVERMFEKLRIIVAGVKDEVGALTKTQTAYVSQADMEKYVSGIIDGMMKDEQSAFTERPIKCIACGRTKMPADESLRNRMMKTTELPVLKQK